MQAVRENAEKQGSQQANNLKNATRRKERERERKRERERESKQASTQASRARKQAKQAKHKPASKQASNRQASFPASKQARRQASKQTSKQTSKKGNQATLGMRILNSCFDAFFCLDMVVVCRTGIIERRKENDERFISFITSHVVKRYLRTWFFIDLVATIPWKNVYEVAYHSGFNMGMASWQVRMLELVRLVRVVRIITMRKNLGRWEDVLQVGGFCGG